MRLDFERDESAVTRSPTSLDASPVDATPTDATPVDVSPLDASPVDAFGSDGASGAGAPSASSTVAPARFTSSAVDVDSESSTSSTLAARALVDASAANAVDGSAATRSLLAGLRLVLVGDWPPPPGGVAVHLQALHDAAIKVGADVRVLDIGKGRNRGPRLVSATSPTSFALELSRACAWGDVIHLHTSGANPKSWLVTAGVGLASRAGGLKSLVTFHSGHGPNYLRTRPRTLAARLALSRYDRVVCVNREISRALSQINAASGRHVLAPAFGKEGLTPGEVPEAVHTPLRHNRRLVTAMLAPGRDYGERELIASFASVAHRHPESLLVLYGPGTDSAETREALLRAGIESTITLGSISRPSALALLRASTVFVRPTRVDGDAVSVREALAMGARVVATQVGHRPDGVLLCEPGNSESLAKALHQALNEGRPANAPPGEQDGIDAVLNVYAQLIRQTNARRMVK